MADRIAHRLWGLDQTAFPALSALCRSRSLRVDLQALGIIRSDRFVCLDCFGTPAESNPRTGSVQFRPMATTGTHSYSPYPTSHDIALAVPAETKHRVPMTTACDSRCPQESR